ncbi:hypothetical protein [Halorubrum sp. DTA46]|uniref:hypothetical protein n=1 Tax=Halorubrum sp. DTA46 TaxID=3402162 RepID=UPI003AAFEB30
MVVSVHHYELSESATPSEFRDAVNEAVDRGLFENVPGLVDYRIGRGIRGDRAGRFAAVWIYESREAWADVWGPADDPVTRTDYPDEWLTWEDELLDPLLSEDPDAIEYTSYELVAGRADMSESR